jgi:hypothetical protein
LCGPPRSDGRARGAQMAACDGELIREEAATEEVLMLEARAVSTSLERLLDVATETTILWGGSDGGQEQRWA